MPAASHQDRPVSAPGYRRRSVAQPLSARRRGNPVESSDGRQSYTFTDCEISILRAAQLNAQRADGIGRTRTVTPSYLGSSDWSKSREAGMPPDFTQLRERPAGTNMLDSTMEDIVAKMSGKGLASITGHSTGSLGLERSKAAYAAVKQRFTGIDDPKNLQWYDGVGQFMRSSEPELKKIPIVHSPDGKVLNQSIKRSPVISDFERRVERGRNQNSPRTSVSTGTQAMRGSLLNASCSSSDYGTQDISLGQDSPARNKAIKRNAGCQTDTPQRALMLVHGRGRDAWLYEGGGPAWKP